MHVKGCAFMNKAEKLKAAWSLYFSNNNIYPKEGDIKCAYHFTSSEKIYAQYHLLNTQALIITNAAIYFNDIRWSLANICKFAIFQSDSKIFLTKISSSCYCLNFSNTAEAKSFLEQIIKMQSYWLSIATNGSKQREELFIYASEMLSTAINQNTPVHTDILYASLFLLYHTDFKKEIGLKLIEYQFSRGDFDSLLCYVRSLSNAIDNLTISNYIESLFNKHSPKNICLSNKFAYDETQPEIVTKVASLLLKYQNSIEIERDILEGKIRSYSILLQKLSNQPNKYDKYLKLWLNFSAEQIRIAREAIIIQSSLSSPTTLSNIDNYGMFCFNYAILFNNKSVIKYFDSLNLQWNLSTESLSPLSSLFDPIFIAFYRKDLDTYNYLITRSKEFISLSKTLSVIRKRLHSTPINTNSPFYHQESNKILSDIKAQERYIASLKSERVKKKISWQTISNAENRLLNMKEYYQHVTINENNSIKKQIHARYAELKEAEQHVINEIEQIKLYYNNKYSDYISFFAKKEDPFINMMLFSYINPVEFCSKAFYNMTSIIFCYGIPFIVNNDYFLQFKNWDKRKSTHSEDSADFKHENGKHSNTTFKKEAKVSDVKKPYGNNWFSPEAHKDLSVLKHEYRKLILKYHPDSPDGSTEIFIDIQKERAMLIDEMGR